MSAWNLPLTCSGGEEIWCTLLNCLQIDSISSELNKSSHFIRHVIVNFLLLIQLLLLQLLKFKSLSLVNINLEILLAESLLYVCHALLLLQLLLRIILDLLHHLDILLLVLVHRLLYAVGIKVVAECGRAHLIQISGALLLTIDLDVHLVSLDLLLTPTFAISVFISVLLLFLLVFLVLLWVLIST